MDCVESGSLEEHDDTIRSNRDDVKQTHPNPLNPTKDYSEIVTRIQSFEGKWFAPLKPSMEKMAKAGFVFTGAGDFVTCYRCGLNLHNWKKNDDPDSEHQFHIKEQKKFCPLYKDIQQRDFYEKDSADVLKDQP